MVDKKQTQEDEPSALESEILREVEEDLRQEELKKLWKKISPFFTTAVVAALIGTGGYEYRQHLIRQQSALESEQLQDALADIENGKTDTALTALKSLRDSSSLGYKWLAALQYADVLAAENRPDEAVKALDYVANDKTAPQSLRSLATLNGVSLSIDAGKPDYAALKTKLAPMIEANNVWTADALELDALIALRQGDAARAKEDYVRITALPKVSDLKRMRATENLNSLNKKAEE